MKQKIKLILGFLIVSSLISFVGYFSFETANNTLKESIGENSILVANQAMNMINTNLEKQIELFQILIIDREISSLLIDSNKEFAELENPYEIIDQRDSIWRSTQKNELTPFMLELINNPESDSLRMHQEFFIKKYGYNILGEVFVTNAFGANVIQTGKTTDYKQNDESWWQIAKKDGVHVGKISYDDSAEMHARDISVRIDDNEGNFLGVIKHVVNVQDIFSVLEEINLNKRFETQHITLLDDEFDVIFSSKEPFSENISFKKILDPNIVDQISGKKGYFLTSKTESEPSKLVSFFNSQHRFDQTSWTILIDYNTDEILKPIDELRFVLLIVFSVTTGLAILFGLYVSNSISKPILELEKATKKIAQGDFDTQIPIQGDDEIRSLSLSFQEMTNSIRKHIELEKKLAVEKEKLKTEKLSVIGELSARISHDIRNPLSILKGDFEILQKKKLLDEKQSRRIGNAINRINHQIDEVLDFVRKTPLKYSKFSLSEIVKDMVGSMDIPPEVKINFSNDEIFVLADKHQLIVALTNLLLNSIQAIEEKGVIDIILSETSTETMIEVIDYGPGFGLELKEKIFEPLFTTKQSGTGLGLVSVKNIIEQHEGTISVKNNPTTFTIKIPKRGEPI